MSSILGVDVAKAFAQLYDELMQTPPVATELETWPASPAYRQAEVRVTGLIGTGLQIDESSLTAEIAAGRPATMGALAAIDTVLRRANDDNPGRTPQTIELQKRRWRQGGYYVSADDGAVLSRRASQREPQQGAETLADKFDIVRVAPESWTHAQFIVVDSNLDYRVLPGDELRVAALPMSVLPEDLDMTSTQTAQGRPVYIARPGPDLHAHVSTAATAVHGADLALAPESTLDANGLDAWQLAATSEMPTWVFAGTGPVGGDLPGGSAPLGTGTTVDGDELMPNRGVLLHGPTGDVIAVQDKRSGFTILPGLLAAYRLPNDPPVGHDEGMEPGRTLTVVESKAGRFAVFICEDLGREMDLAADLVGFGITHLLVPILATPIRVREWHQSIARRVTQRAGTTVVVFNSLVLGREENPAQPAATMMVVEQRADAYAGEEHMERNLGGLVVAPRDDALTPRGRDIVTR